MSRIGRKTILIPESINVKIDNQTVIVQGPKGQLSYTLSAVVKIEKSKNELKLVKIDRSPLSQKIYGLSRTLINNMVIGVSRGFSKKLEIQGVGYRSQMNGQHLVLNVGYSHPVIIKPPSDIEIKVENNTNIRVVGIDKETVGHMAAKIRNIRPPEPYKGKGIRYAAEVIRRKVGKAGK